MTCPRCFAEFNPAPGSSKLGKCPECGVQFVHNISGVVKTSAVMIAAAGCRGFYRSVQDVPEPLRKQLLAITASANSGTIVIADRAGREQITQVIGRREITTRERRNSVQSARKTRTRSRTAFPRGSWIFWTGVFLLLLAVAAILAVFAAH